MGDPRQMGRLTEFFGYINRDPQLERGYLNSHLMITEKIKEIRKSHLTTSEMSEENKLVKVETRLPKFVEDAYDSVEKMEKFADILLSSQLVPNHFYAKLPDNKPDFSKGKTPAVVAVLIQGYQLGLPPLTALQHIVPVNGLLSIKGDLAKSMIFGSGKLKSGTWIEKEEGSIEGENLKISITATRSDNGQTITRSFSVDMAKRAGLWITTQQVNGQDGWKYKSSPWYKYPSRMVYYRALGFLARDLFPDVMAGTYTTEEAVDMPADNSIIIDQGNGTTIRIPDKEFASGRSQTITSRVVEKIKAPEFAPVQEETPPESMPIYEGPHDIGGVDYSPREEQQPDEPPFEPDPPRTTAKLTIAGMSEMDTEDLLRIVREDSELSEAMMLVPGKNTNKKLREIIFAHQEGKLEEYLQPYVDHSADRSDFGEPMPTDDKQGQAPPPMTPSEELIQPTGKDLNKYNLEVPGFDKGNERAFETKRELYHLLNSVNPQINNERYLELAQGVPEWSSYTNKEAFCQYATIQQVCMLLNKN